MRPSLRWAVVCAIALAGCGGGDKAGGEGGVTTLELGTADTPGTLGAQAVEWFARDVERRSGGTLRVKVAWEANLRVTGNHAPSWDQDVAGLVRDGDLDLGWVPARTWDTLGTTSLQALQAPFLITSHELVGAVVRSQIADEMLGGLSKSGVVGLGLVPEDLRHPVAFEGTLHAPADFEGRTLRVPRSHISYELFRTLGAHPVDLSGGAPQAARSAGRLDGAESSLAAAGSTLPGSGSITANVTFFPKVGVLVSGDAAFERLSDDQRATLRAAAEATRDHMVEAAPTEAESAAAACREGFVGVSLAGPADVEALEIAARPVYGQLERDALTRDLIARIRSLAAETDVSSAPAQPCDPPETATAAEPETGPDDPGVINGVYRFFISEREMLDAGVDARAAFENHGLNTMTLDNGRFSVDTTETRFREYTCSGHYTVSGDTAEFTITNDGCIGHWRLRWKRYAAGLRMTHVASLPPHDSPRDHLLDRVVWASKPWRRIADVERAPAFPEGVYRTEITVDQLIRGGFSPANARNHYGIWTLTLEGGRFTAATLSAANAPSCTGDYVVSGREITLTADRTEACGTAAGGVFFEARWSFADGGLTFGDMRPDDRMIGFLFGSRPWEPIG